MTRSRLSVSYLAEGRRLHLGDGPIDLVIEANGEAEMIAVAHDAAIVRAATILDELCAELPLLRSASTGGITANSVVARRMQRAVARHARTIFITPMAAVAGSVAEEVLAAMCGAARLDRAWVNNGGDIALHLAEGASLTIGMVDRPDRPSLFGTIAIAAGDRVRGIATSGWRGRSFSLGIADAVSVLAVDAASADAAATAIANAVDLPGHSAIRRAAANTLDPQSDLGDRAVTVAVGHLALAEVARALDSGEERARDLADTGAIVAAAIHLQGVTRIVGGAAWQPIITEDDPSCRPNFLASPSASS
ncbi:MAG TPA: UPF0280 family protein [Acidiphilium sp.]